MAPKTSAQSSTERAMGPSLSILQPASDRRLHIQLLLLERGGAPGGLVAGVGDQVLRAPWDAVQRPAVAPGGNLTVRLLRLFHRQVVGQRDDAVQDGVVLLESF